MTSTAVTLSLPEPSASPMPLTVILRSHIPGAADFFPFDDVATLGTSSVDEFSFKDLIDDGIDGGPQITLFANGCLVDGAADCPRACNDTAVFFGSLETFYNCAALASIAYWTRDVKTYYVSRQAERNASSIMGSGTLAAFNDKPVLSKFVTCAQGACAGDELSTPCSSDIGGLSSTSSSAKQVFHAMDTFCPDISAQINPDIFGPGVLISYILQTCFSSLLYVFLKAFTLWVEYTQHPIPRRQNRLTRIPTIIWRDSSALSRTSIAIATTLVEFQEAQGWFVGALQLATILAIVVNSQDGTFWGEVIVNGAIAYHISQNGVLPMFLIQICLHNEGIRNWHTFLGFLLEYLLAIVATTQKISFQSAFQGFKSQNPIKACGNNPSPRTYCAASKGVYGIQLSFFPHPLLYKMVFLVLDSIAILVLTIDQLAWTLRKHYKTKHIKFRGHEVGRFPKGRLKPYWIKFSTWAWRVLEVSYLIVNLLFLVSLTKVINGESFAANKWSYGQIIAVTVWGPVVIKLFDLMLSGPPRNGPKIVSGPPRLRIDNVINKRFGTMSMSEDELEEEPEPPPPRPRRVSHLRFQDDKQEETITDAPGEATTDDYDSGGNGKDEISAVEEPSKRTTDIV